MKKKIIFALAVLTIFSLQTVNAQNINLRNIKRKITEQEYNNLQNLGFTDIEIGTMDNEEYSKNSHLDAVLVGSNTIYSKDIYIYRLKNQVISFNLTKKNSSNINDDNLELVSKHSVEITEQEYNDMNNKTLITTHGEDIVETTGKKLTTTISYISSSNRYRLKNTLEWKNMPKKRYNELYGILYEEANVNTVVGSQRAYYIYDTLNNCYGTGTTTRKDYSDAKYWNTKYKSYYMSFPLKKDKSVTYTWDNPSLNNPGSTCPCINPPEFGNSVTRINEVKSMTATMYYDILKSTTTKITALTVAGEYQHSTKQIGLDVSLSFGIKSLSINITPAQKKNYDGMKNTKIQLTNINW